MPPPAGVARPPELESPCEMPVRWSSLPVFKGSMPYSAGNTAVKSSTSATAKAVSVAFTMAALEGASAATSFSASVMLCGPDVSGDLISHQKEADGHEYGIGRERVAQETAACSPDAESDQDRRERQHLADLHADVEAQNIRHQAVAREFQLLQLGGEPEAVEQAENQNGELGVGLESE